MTMPDRYLCLYAASVASRPRAPAGRPRVTAPDWVVVALYFGVLLAVIAWGMRNFTG